MQRRRFLASSATLAASALRAGEGFCGDAPAASLHEPTRYAFVADRFSHFISVIDIVMGKHMETLNFGLRPRVFEMARDDAMMAVGSPEVAALCFFHLQTRQLRRLPLPSPPYQVFFVPQSPLVAVGLRDQVALIDYETFELKVFARRFDSPTRDTQLNTYYSLLFSSFGQNFWVLDEERPRLYRQHGQADADAPWEEIDLSARIASGSGLGIGVASPEDALLALTCDDGSEGLLYFPATGQSVSTGPMRRVGSTNEPMLMPYVDASTRHVLFGDVQGQMALLRLDDEARAGQAGHLRPERFQLDFSPRVIRSGWLESTWVIGGDRALLFQSIADSADRQLHRFREAVTGIWVTGDSKTALVTLDEGPPRLHRWDIRTRSALEPLPVPRVVMPGLVRMGSNNSICY